MSDIEEKRSEEEKTTPAFNSNKAINLAIVSANEKF